MLPGASFAPDLNRDKIFTRPQQGRRSFNNGKGVKHYHYKSIYELLVLLLLTYKIYMSEHQDDKELLTRFKNEQTRESAYTAIIKKYQEKLYWHVRRMVVDHDDANDVLQNMFIKVWKNLDNFREDSQLYTWLYRIATNESLTFLEQQKKRTSASLSDEEGYLSNKLVADKDFDGNKLEWKLQLAIQQLPEKQKAVFNLRYFEEMPYEEMSRVLETSEGALKASYHHAVKKIEDYILNR